MIREVAAGRVETAPVPDDHVYTHDGKRLGLVTGRTDGHFKVHMRWGRDYWLNRELIRMREPGKLTLHISRDVVSNYKTRKPESDPTVRPARS